MKAERSDVAVVIPWRSTGPDRDAAKDNTVKALKAILPDAKFIFADSGHKVFNRSASRNKGVAEAEALGCTRVVVCDADTIPEKKPLLEAVDACMDGVLHLPYNRVHLLNEDGSIRAEVTHSVGGVWVMSVEAWQSVGGQDEGFTGWGYEDDSFYLITNTLLGPAVRHEGLIVCQWHKEEWVWGSEAYRSNRQRYLHQQALANEPKKLRGFLTGTYKLAEKPLRIAVMAHYYVPRRNAGSETMLHAMLVALRQRGHQIRAYISENPGDKEPYTVDGIEVFSSAPRDAMNLVEQWQADVVISHHKLNDYAHAVARRMQIPWVMLIHNSMPYTLAHLGLKPDLAVVNTRWIPQMHAEMFEQIPWITVHPPVDANKHRTTPGDRVTLVNMIEAKGARLFYWLAKWMPDVKFLGVEGGYGDQILEHDLPNVEIVPHTANMAADVWSRTKILLMPSEYESYGMVGVEALASGIPVIAHPTEGLLESLGFAGTFVDREDGQGWVYAIDSLLEPENYEAASVLARNRSKELDPTDELNEWISAIETLARR